MTLALLAPVHAWREAGKEKGDTTPSWSGNIPIPILSIWRPFISCQRTNFWQNLGAGCDYSELFIHAFGSLDATLIGRN